MNARFFFSYPNAETPPCFATSWILPTKLYEFNENFPNDIGTQHLTWKSWKWGPSFDWLLGCASFSTRVARDRPATTDRNWKDPLVCRFFYGRQIMLNPFPQMIKLIWSPLLSDVPHIIDVFFFQKADVTSASSQAVGCCWVILILFLIQTDIGSWPILAS